MTYNSHSSHYGTSLCDRAGVALRFCDAASGEAGGKIGDEIGRWCSPLSVISSTTFWIFFVF
jgi:hypothetical protein